jgi:hypothetical protein
MRNAFVVISCSLTSRRALEMGRFSFARSMCVLLSVCAMLALVACDSILAGFTPGANVGPSTYPKSTVADESFENCTEDALKRRLSERRVDDDVSLVDVAMADCMAEEVEVLRAEIAENGKVEGRKRFDEEVALTRGRLQTEAAGVAVPRVR